MIATTALLIGSLISSLIGAGSQIAGAKMNANAQLKANRQENFNNSQQNNLINLQNQQNQLNGSDYTDMYRDRISMMKCGGSRIKAKNGTEKTPSEKRRKFQDIVYILAGDTRAAQRINRMYDNNFDNRNAAVKVNEYFTDRDLMDVYHTKTSAAARAKDRQSRERPVSYTKLFEEFINKYIVNNDFFNSSGNSINSKNEDIKNMNCGGARRKSLYGSSIIDAPHKYYTEGKYDKIISPEFRLKGSNQFYNSYRNENPKINTNNYIDPATLSYLLSYAMRCGGSKKRK